MSRTQKNKHNSSQSFEDMKEMQDHITDPGYYIGTGRVPPHVSAPGNPKPLGILYILASAFFFGLGILLMFSDVRVASSGLIESDLVNKIIMTAILAVIALFCLIMGLAYFRKAKKRTKHRRSSKRK
ncbi:MAG: hypothetical protein E7553_05770 [Ruminococcaceae bacterium]|nr:hypothetical protein [Oscillospiraceae bacterium]